MAPADYPPDVVGIVNLPNQLHQIAYRKGINFNIMVVGEFRLGHCEYDILMSNASFQASPGPARRRESARTRCPCFCLLTFPAASAAS
jgi:septin family protein